MAVLTAVLQEQLCSLPRFLDLVEFCMNSSEHFRDNRTYWSSARTALLPSEIPWFSGVLYEQLWTLPK